MKVIFFFGFIIFLLLGCYFKSDHFENGERIFTQEPCLNCTCIDSTVMCYLRVCPFVKPLGEDCVEVKNEDDCCPTFHCPEGNNFMFQLILFIHEHHKFLFLRSVKNQHTLKNKTFKKI